MSRGLFSFLLLSAISCFADVQILPSLLPAGAFPQATATDSAGNIYIVGEIENEPVVDAFVAKFSPDGSRMLYLTTLAGSRNDVATGIAVGPDGSAYVTGATASADFPTTEGAMQRSLGSDAQAFVVKLDFGGKVQYSTLIGGTATASGKGVAVDKNGNAYVTGSVSSEGFPITPDAVHGDSPEQTFSSGFVVKLNPAGSSALLSTIGFGGTAIALGTDGMIYAAGAPTYPAPTTPDAFQKSAGLQICFSSFLGFIRCGHQHVVKLHPSGTTFLYGTYVSGYWGATPANIAVDTDGSVILAGSTFSPDYPTMPSGYLPQYLMYPSQSLLPPFGAEAPASSGYITRLNSTGTGLVWSTFFSGSGTQAIFDTYVDGDTITGMAVDRAGNIVIGGLAKSPDLPGLWTTPVDARPKPGGTATSGFVTRFTPDGVKLSATQLTRGFPAGIAVRSDNSAVLGGGAVVTLSNPPRVASITDTDNTRLVRIAPGQLLTLYGTKLSPARDDQPSGSFPTSFNWISVSFNGIAAPILYASGDQVNLQVPFEVAGQTEVTMKVSGDFGDPPFSESFILGVVARQPSVLLSGTNFSGSIFGADACRGFTHCVQPLAVNADGTINSADNPAAAGSAVTIFMNGVGLTSPALETGAIPQMITALSPGLRVVGVPFESNTNATVLDTSNVPGSSTTLAQVRIQVPAVTPSVVVPLGIQEASGGQYLMRGLSVLIWTK